MTPWKIMMKRLMNPPVHRALPPMRRNANNGPREQYSCNQCGQLKGAIAYRRSPGKNRHTTCRICEALVNGGKK
jgi:predicted SprT family Zn-dependent metalloprotease